MLSTGSFWLMHCCRVGSGVCSHHRAHMGEFQYRCSLPVSDLCHTVRARATPSVCPPLTHTLGDQVNYGIYHTQLSLKYLDIHNTPMMSSLKFHLSVALRKIENCDFKIVKKIIQSVQFTICYAYYLCEQQLTECHIPPRK